MSQFLISIIRPRGYRHSDAFMEVAETLCLGLRRLGHRAAVFENKIAPQAINILLGAHLLDRREAGLLPPGTIVYNLEQLGAPYLKEHFYGLACRCRIWDYSPLNLALWMQRRCAQPPTLVEIGYVPEWTRIPVAPIQDIDVLFYGSINEHRRAIFLRLREAGIGIHAVFGVYGRERDALIARAKIVLNLHCYPTKLFEVVRVSYLLANAKAVVSEASPDIGDFAQTVEVASPDGMVDAVSALLADESRRKRLEARGFEFFTRRPVESFLEKAIGPLIGPTQSTASG
ncbi:glycosyltransferase family 1 protein [Silvibacterium dinghuense]|uniref:Glycosyltransferase n=1 Tax=Silvibacterium dinghuense TaxID=1560006 RepID=A0A4Q1SKR4_9BACT|nr:glycosyltransferase family 1 protein [Silvibacterium dinghuense]RXS97900.1 hypothetical protein ESZ00_08600 [Silvibacterium dinghuense]GGH02839.1 hypothetical protein GCM10011586_18400 [Silvibacterium dinghuense]